MTRPLQPNTDTDEKNTKPHTQDNDEEKKNCTNEEKANEINETKLNCMVLGNKDQDLLYVPHKGDEDEEPRKGSEKGLTFLISDNEDMDNHALESQNDGIEIRKWNSSSRLKLNFEDEVQIIEPDLQEFCRRKKGPFDFVLHWMRATILSIVSILLMHIRNEIFERKGRKRRKFSLSEHPLRENIRYYVNIFCMEMCNQTFRKFSLKDILTKFKFPTFHIPSLFTVYPAYTLGECYREIESNPHMTFRERMQYNLLRTSTFSKFPRNSPVSTLSLSKAGFYYEGKADEVICFKCGIKHRNWRHLDDPIQIHKEISPSCPFMSSLESESRLTNVVSNSRRSANDASVLYRREDESRNNNFRNDIRNNASNSHNESTSHNDTPQNTDNLRSGIYSVQDSSFRNGGENNVSSSSESRVAAVNSDDANGRPTQKPVDRTSNPRLSNNATPSSPTQGYGSSNDNIPTCRSNNVFSQTEGTSSQNIAASSTPSNTTTSNAHPKSAASTLEPLGISVEKPKYPQYAVLATRISSFQNWPEHLQQKPEELARAGFLYEGTNDFTRCFFCAGGLRDWEPEDNPWIEHARWYKNCVFVRQCKGEEFVNLIQQGKIQEAMGKLEGRRCDEKEQIEDIMKSTAALSVKEMGYDEELIRRAIETFSRNQDMNTMTADSLLQCVWKLEEGDKNDMNFQHNTHPNQTQNRSNENQLASNPSSDNAEESTEALLAENRQLKDQQICKICMDEDISIVFLPCGHMVTCVNCAPAVRKCPLCRRFIKGTVKAILS